MADVTGGPGREPITDKASAARALGRWINDPDTNPADVDAVIADLLNEARGRRDRERGNVGPNE
ncbi:hypothetical protein BAY59_38445 (plasmid) [Prauserella coralliicola]|nr:hypothetical protein BAY59_38445 [Prauserella coralliicola]